MKSDVIKVNASGNGVKEALTQTEKIAEIKGLSQEDQMKLRLLTEEMMGRHRLLLLWAASAHFPPQEAEPPCGRFHSTGIRFRKRRMPRTPGMNWRNPLLPSSPMRSASESGANAWR